jgi:hypothetical protein
MGLPQDTGDPNHAAQEGVSEPFACFEASLLRRTSAREPGLPRQPAAEVAG